MTFKTQKWILICFLNRALLFDTFAFNMYAEKCCEKNMHLDVITTDSLNIYLKYMFLIVLHSL